MQAKLSEVWGEPVIVNRPPEEFSSFVREEVRKWGRVAADNNISVE